MHRILIISFDSELEKVLSVINREKTEIVGVITLPLNTLQSIVEKFNLNCKISFYDEMPEIVQKKYFDYVIVSDVIKDAGTENRFVADLKRVGVPAEKILNFSHFGTFPFVSICNTLKNICTAPKSARRKFNFFVTGVSHAYAGTDVTAFSMQGVNLALTSQDLFYDYELAKMILKNKLGARYAIIGVSPFSLNYDLSQGVNSDRAFAYYPITKTLHNHHFRAEILPELFNDTYIKSYDLFTAELKFDGCLRSCTQNRDFNLNDFIDVRKKLLEQKEHLQTVAENKKILQSYVKDCLKADVLPLLVIYPVSEFYNKYFSARKFEELRYFLTDLSTKFKVPFLDFAADNNFTLADFFDVEHLNSRGAKKFSGILNAKLLEQENKKSR